MHFNKSGFTLTELSVSLVIIGFLLAAALSGDNLLRLAKARAIAAEMQDYKVAVSSFVSKYGQFPGDFNDAESYWGAANTNNGDNNGKIEYINGSGSYEGYLAWQHLSLSRMIDGDYAGTQTMSDPVLGTDVPKSRTGGGYIFEYEKLNIINSNALYLGTLYGSDLEASGNGILTSNEAFAIDSKADDGLASEGSIRTREGFSSGEESCLDAPQTDYNLEATGKDCTMAFKISGN